MPRGKKAAVETENVQPNAVVAPAPVKAAAAAAAAPVVVKTEKADSDDLLAQIQSLTDQVNSLKIKNKELSTAVKKPKAAGGKKPKDDRPKHPMTAFLFYAKENREQVKEANPGLGVTEVAKIMGEQWSKLADAKKKKYMKMAEEAKAKYEVEMEAWKKKQTRRENKEKAVQLYKDHLEQKTALEFYREHQKLAAEEAESKNKKKNKDPNRPKRPMSAFLFYADEVRAGVIKDHPKEGAKEWMKIVGEMWKGLSEKQKQKYNTRAAEAKKKYLAAMEAYKLTLKEEQAQLEAEKGKKEKELEKEALKFFVRVKKEEELKKAGKKAIQAAKADADA